MVCIQRDIIGKISKDGTHCESCPVYLDCPNCPEQFKTALSFIETHIKAYTLKDK